MEFLHGLEPYVRRQVEAKRERDSAKGIRPDRPGLQTLDVPERCLVARLRAGRTLDEVSASTGISKVSLIRRERGEGLVNELAKYWGVEPEDGD